MNKGSLLSIVIPASQGRYSELYIILRRLMLSASKFPNHEFEVVCVVGGDFNLYSKLPTLTKNYFSLKLICIPNTDFVNPAYPRNVAIRFCNGKIIGMMDVDHWPGENIVYGMTNPFIHDADYTVCWRDESGYKCEKIVSAIEFFPQTLNYQFVHGSYNVLNRGYVIDSSNSGLDLDRRFISEFIKSPLNATSHILDVYERLKIPHGVNNTLWTWSTLRSNLLAINGYDECYCVSNAYGREDDDLRERLKRQIEGYKEILPKTGFFDDQNMNFCSIHLWHEQRARSQDERSLNVDYFKKANSPVISKGRNSGHNWGKLIKGSKGILDDTEYQNLFLEEWIANNIKDSVYYNDLYDCKEELQKSVHNLKLNQQLIYT